jgi:hypothetical protein
MLLGHRQNLLHQFLWEDSTLIHLFRMRVDSHHNGDALLGQEVKLDKFRTLQ